MLSDNAVHEGEVINVSSPESLSLSTDDEEQNEDDDHNKVDTAIAEPPNNTFGSPIVASCDGNPFQDQDAMAPSYKYTDYSRMATAATHKQSLQTQSQRAMNNDIRVQVLPVKLAAMLAEPRFAHIVTWMPHGRAWKVLRVKEFTEQVAPHYFEYPNYNSFIRLVNAWGFRRIKTGVDSNAYFHELFLKDIPHLHKMMKRLHKNQKKPHLHFALEPDFCNMPRIESSTVGHQLGTAGHNSNVEKEEQQKLNDNVASKISSLQTLQQRNLDSQQLNLCHPSTANQINASQNNNANGSFSPLVNNMNNFAQPSSLFQQQQQGALDSTTLSNNLLNNSETQQLLSLVSSQALQQQVLANVWDQQKRQQEQRFQQLVQNHLSQERLNLFASLQQHQNTPRENPSSTLLNSLLLSAGGQASTDSLINSLQQQSRSVDNNTSASSFLDQIRASEIMLQHQRRTPVGPLSGNAQSSSTHNSGTQPNSSE